eukprot:g2976.t1
MAFRSGGIGGASLSGTSDGDSELPYGEDVQKETVILADDFHLKSNGHREVDIEHGSLPDDATPIEDETEGLTSKNKEKQYAAVLANLDDRELDRYEAYRRSCLPRSKMRKLLMSLSSLQVHDDKILIVICSLAKMFVGQLIQESRRLAGSVGESGPLRPEHVRKAFKLLETQGRRLRRRSSKPFFRIYS